MKLITLAKRFNFTCYWCKDVFKLEELSRDHIKRYRQLVREGIIKERKGRRRRGGGSRASGGKNNLVLACKVCNLSRD